MESNEFSLRYKSLENSELLKIIENASDYQSEAVKAAQIELEFRNLSETDIQEAELEIAKEQEEKEIKKEKIRKIESKIDSKLQYALESVNPFQKSIPTPEKRIRFLIILFSFLLIYQWYHGYEFVLMFLDIETFNGEAFFAMIDFLLPLISLPLALILFYLRKKMGWVLMLAYLSYQIILLCVLIYLFWDYEPIPTEIGMLVDPGISVSNYIWGLLFYIGIVWTLMSSELRKVYACSAKLGWITIASILLINIVWIYGVQKLMS